MESYVYRKITIIDINDVKSIRACKTEELVLSFDLETTKYNKDFGMLCYSKTKKATATNSSLVVESSLQESRCSILKKVLIAYINKRNSVISNISFISNLSTIFRYINKHNPTIDLGNKEDSFQLYSDYSKYLLSKVISVDKKSSMSSAYASRLQHALAFLISITLDIDKDSILIRSQTIPSEKNTEAVWNFNEHNIESFFLYNMSIFLAIKSFLINGDSLPIHFNFKYDDYKIDCDFIYDRQKRSSIFENNLWCGKHEDLANKAICAFLFCFACVTAANKSSLIAAESDKFEIVPSTQGMRTFVKKNRAKGDSIPLEFGVDFLAYFKEYLEFRSWLLSKYSEESKNVFGSRLFLYIPASFPHEQENYLIHPMTVAMLDNYKKWFRTNFSDSWIPLRGLRQLVSTEFLKKTNSVRLASLKLGNNMRTFVASYGQTTFNDSANEMSNALDNIFGNILDNTYIYKPSEIETLSTPMGNCSNIKKKSINPTIAIEPDCRRPESCLFCSNFVLHPDKTDIKKLLSVLDMFKLSKKKNSEQGILIQERIIQILGDLQTTFPETKDLIPLIQDEVDEGDLDEYWSEIAMTLQLLESI